MRVAITLFCLRRLSTVDPQMADGQFFNVHCVGLRRSYCETSADRGVICLDAQSVGPQKLRHQCQLLQTNKVTTHSMVSLQDRLCPRVLYARSHCSRLVYNGRIGWHIEQSQKEAGKWVCQSVGAQHMPSC